VWKEPPQEPELQLSVVKTPLNCPEGSATDGTFRWPSPKLTPDWVVVLPPQPQLRIVLVFPQSSDGQLDELLDELDELLLEEDSLLDENSPEELLLDENSPEEENSPLEELLSAIGRVLWKRGYGSIVLGKKHIAPNATRRGHPTRPPSLPSTRLSRPKVPGIGLREERGGSGVSRVDTLAQGRNAEGRSDAIGDQLPALRGVAGGGHNGPTDRRASYGPVGVWNVLRGGGVWRVSDAALPLADGVD
jgi:hypothetical protein